MQYKVTLLDLYQVPSGFIILLGADEELSSTFHFPIYITRSDQTILVPRWEKYIDTFGPVTAYYFLFSGQVTEQFYMLFGPVTQFYLFCCPVIAQLYLFSGSIAEQLYLLSGPVTAVLSIL